MKATDRCTFCEQAPGSKIHDWDKSMSHPFIGEGQLVSSKAAEAPAGQVRAMDLSSGEDVYRSAPAAPSERTDGRKEAVNRLAKFIAQKESFNCKTLDESLHHQSKWKRIIPEAEELLNAAFPVSSQEGK